MRRSKYRLLLQNIPPYSNYTEVDLPVVTTTQQVSSTAAQTVNGRLVFDPSDFDMEHIGSFVAVCEWESAASGSIVLYDETNGTTIATLASPTAATQYTISTQDITQYLKSLTSPITIVVQATGSTAGAITVHKVTIKATAKL